VAFAAGLALPDNAPMPVSVWQKRIERAQRLITLHPYAAEILQFYVRVASFQENLHRSLGASIQSMPASLRRELTGSELAELGSRFEPFVNLAATYGPETLRGHSRELIARGEDFWIELIQRAWCASSSDATGHLAHIFLQPYAELLRSHSAAKPSVSRSGVCPFCYRKPSAGVLRQLGEGAARSLICSFCLAEWEFRRLVCPACGEENDRNLPVFTAEAWDYIRVEACEKCKTYIKTIDRSKNGNADAVVDELASAALDLWAHERGYAKLQNNLLGM
jgi:FdhE protein